MRYFRNAMCPDYDKCLNKAAFDFSLPDSWNCAGCRNETRHLEAGDLPANDLEGCQKLLAVLFRPDVTPWGPRNDQDAQAA